MEIREGLWQREGQRQKGHEVQTQEGRWGEAGQEVQPGRRRTERSSLLLLVFAESNNS